MTAPPSGSSGEDSTGPLIVALVAAVAATAPLGAVLAGLPLTLRIVLILLAPGFAVSATAVAISLGWIFLLIGRQGRYPRRLKLTIALQGVAVVEMLGLILLMLRGAGG